MYFADGLAVDNIRWVRKIAGLVLAVVLAATVLVAANDQEAAAQSESSDQRAAARCSAFHLFGAEPVDVAKTADGQTVLAQARWGWNGSICYLALDDDAVAALRAAGPPESLPQGQTDASRRCFARHRFGAQPVDVAKTADGQTVLARVSWGWNGIICYLALDPTAVNTLRAVAALPEAPGAPDNVSTATGNRQITMTWTAPADDGGGAITSYTVAYKARSRVCPTAIDSSWTYRTTTGTSITLANLANGTDYRLCVKATNRGGDSDWATANAIPASVPSAPTNTKATAGNQQISITWTAPADNGAAITSYTIQRCVAVNRACTSTWADAGTATTPRHTITGLANGTAHGIRIRATNANGAGSWSSTAFGNTVVIPPGTPSNLTTEVGSGYITLTWNAPSTGGSSITRYTVECRLASGAITTGNCNSSSWIAYGTTTRTTITLSSLTNGVSYDLRVKATNRVGDSEWSSTATTTASALPGTPANVQALTSGRNISVTWDAPISGGAPITRYTVQYCSGGCTSWRTTNLTGNPPRTSTTLTSLSRGTNYTVRVRATNIAGDGAWSRSASAATPALPGRPTGLTLSSIGNDEMTASWTAPADTGLAAATSYKVQRCNASSRTDGTWYCYGWSNVGTTSSTSYTISGLNGSTAYSVRVQGVNDAGGGSWSTSSTQTTAAAEAPGIPGSLTATAANGQITLRWTASDANGASISKYTVECRNDGLTESGNCKNSSWTQYTTTTSTSTTIYSLTNGNSYSFQVKATNKVGDSPYTSEVSTTPATKPGRPTNLTLTESYDQTNGYHIDVTWGESTSNGSTISHYTLEYRVANGNWSLAAVSLSTGPHTLTNLKAGTTYYVQVKANSNQGDSDWAAKSIRVTGTPDAPTSLSLTSGPGQITASWSEPGTGPQDTTSYNIHRCNTSYNTTTSEYSCYGGWSRAGSATSTTFNITGLSPGTYYGVRVQAVNSAGGGRWSDTVFETTQAATVPSDPSGLTATPGNGQVTLRWTASNPNGASISKYTIECQDNDSNNTTGNCSSDALATYTTTSSTSITIYSLTNGIQYSFQVKATNRVGDSGWAAASATPATKPGKPTNLTLSEGHDGASFTLTVSWDAANSNGSTIDGYTVEYKASGNHWSFATYTSGITHALPDLTKGTYSVRVRTHSDYGDSGWAETSATITGRPGKPGTPGVTGGANQISASWSGPSYTGASSITGYNVQRCVASTKTDGSFSSCSSSWVNVPSVTSGSATMANLACGKAYGVRVQAVNSDGTGPWSDPGAAKTDDCPPSN